MTALGAILGLLLAIVLIIRKVPPVYSLMLGAVVGGLAGGIGLPATVSAMISGVADVSPAVVRILAAGVLSGALVVSGAAESIATFIIRVMGRRHILAAMALAAMLLTATGVFIDVAVITVAPVALSAAGRLRIPRATLLVMLIGGGKCGNVISPNPNTIVSAENFGADLYSVMYANLIPAIIGLIFTVYLIGRLLPKVAGDDEPMSQAGAADSAALPGILPSVAGPVAAVLLLALRPLSGISIDPAVALPVGGIICLLATRRWRLTGESLRYGLEKMSVVAVLLIGTGTIAGIIKASSLKDVILDALSHTGFGESLLAPVSGILMSAATASTTAGATVASSSFAQTILAAGVSAVWGAAMVNSGATVLDHLPHGSFFHATGGAAELSIGKRLRLLPYETAIGFILALGTYTAYMLVG